MEPELTLEGLAKRYPEVKDDIDNTEIVVENDPKPPGEQKERNYKRILRDVAIGIVVSYIVIISTDFILLIVG